MSLSIGCRRNGCSNEPLKGNYGFCANCREKDSYLRGDHDDLPLNKLFRKKRRSDNRGGGGGGGSVRALSNLKHDPLLELRRVLGNNASFHALHRRTSCKSVDCDGEKGQPGGICHQWCIDRREYYQHKFVNYGIHHSYFDMGGQDAGNMRLSRHLYRVIRVSKGRKTVWLQPIQRDGSDILFGTLQRRIQKRDNGHEYVTRGNHHAYGTISPLYTFPCSCGACKNLDRIQAERAKRFKKIKRKRAKIARLRKKQEILEVEINALMKPGGGGNRPIVIFKENGCDILFGTLQMHEGKKLFNLRDAEMAWDHGVTFEWFIEYLANNKIIVMQSAWNELKIEEKKQLINEVNQVYIFVHEHDRLE